MPTTLHEPVHHVHHPRGAFAARRALAARLMLVELRDTVDALISKKRRR